MEYKYWLLSAVRRWRRRKRTKMVTVIKNNLLLIGRLPLRWTVISMVGMAVLVVHLELRSVL
jgi:hypothetical protein